MVAMTLYLVLVEKKIGLISLKFIASADNVFFKMVGQ